MTEKNPTEAAYLTSEDPPSKAALQRKMKKTRESVAKTVDEIKEVATEQYQAAKQTLDGVMNFREQFQNEPLVWSLGALSAGFALGYTMGYAHKHTGRGKSSAVGEFTNSLVEELGTVGKSLVMPTLNVKIKKLFGFDFSELLEEIGEANKSNGRKPVKKRQASKKRAPAKRKKRRSIKKH